MDISIFKKIGFSDKSALVYESLLRVGPTSVRALAAIVNLNRGSVYDSLKWLQEQGFVNFFQKDLKQLFVAESPEKLADLIKNREQSLREAGLELTRYMPELLATYNDGGGRPVARYFAKEEIKEILEDVLATCENFAESEYRVYSTEGIREYLYENFPTFSDVRVGKGIGVKAIAIGEGGELRGLDARKWLKVKNTTPTYIILYPEKTAYISLNAKNEPLGVVIENAGVYETQKIIFDELWNKL